MEDMEEFATKYQSEDSYLTSPKIVNTYNGDSMLTQTLQYNTFTYEKRDYIILQVHGGADVRGGYTKPQIFQIDDIDQFHTSQWDINASDDVNSWYSDDTGHRWYEGPNFRDNLIVWDDKPYSKATGKQIVFWNDCGSCGGNPNNELPIIVEVQKFVQQNYTSPTLELDFLAEFAKMDNFEEMEEIIKKIKEDTISEIENQTLKLEI